MTGLQVIPHRADRYRCQAAKDEARAGARAEEPQHTSHRDGLTVSVYDEENAVLTSDGRGWSALDKGKGDR
jgi:hypothetical protein